MSNPEEGREARHVSIWDRDPMFMDMPNSMEGNSMQGTSTLRRKSLWDLDDPQHFQVPISTSETTGSASQAKKKKSKSAHDKDPAYPPSTYTRYAYEVCLQWYAGKSVKFLEANYLRDPGTGTEKLASDLEARILSKCYESEDFKDVDLTYHSRFCDWMTNTIQTVTFNTKKLMVELRAPVTGQVEDEEAKEFCAKMEWWHTAAKKLSKSGSRGFKWKNDAVKAAFARDGGLSIIWIPPTAKVEPLGGFSREGGHGKVRKVRITGLDTIPANIPLAEKMPKTKDLRNQRVERSIEALACPLNHAGLIKFFALNSITMAAYTLWWNGGHLGDLLSVDKLVSRTTEWHELHRIRQLPEEKQKEVSLFRRHKAKLAWALVYVTHLMHQTLVLHNDLSPRNVLLHYPDYSNEIINIGICDFGLTSRVNENAPSHYGYPTKEETQKQQDGRWWVAPELFYTFGPSDSDTSKPIMQSRHKYTKQSDSYSIGKLVEAMKIGDMYPFDQETFSTMDAYRYFAMKVGQLAKKDSKERPTCTEVVNLVMGPPWYMKPPTFVLRDSPM